MRVSAFEFEDLNSSLSTNTLRIPTFILPKLTVTNISRLADSLVRIRKIGLTVLISEFQLRLPSLHSLRYVCFPPVSSDFQDGVLKVNKAVHDSPDTIDFSEGSTVLDEDVVYDDSDFRLTDVL